MRLVRVELRHTCPFWFLGPINLTPEKPISDIIDLDDIPKEVKKMILDSAGLGRQIKIVEEEFSEGGPIEVRGEEMVSLEDDDLPEIQSATVSEPEGEKKELSYSLEDKEEASILLKKNGNSIRAAAKKMKNASLILACLELEVKGKSRKGVITALQEALKKHE